MVALADTLNYTVSMTLEMKMTEKQIFGTAVRILGLWFVAQAFISMVLQARVLIRYWGHFDVLDRFDIYTPALYLMVGFFMLKRTPYIVKFVFPAKSKE